MDRNLKFILILFPIILVGAYFYGLTFEDVLDGSQFGIPTGSQLFFINCPEGFIEDTNPETSPSPENSFCVLPDASLFLGCGDEYVSPDGIVETVTCSMVVP